MPIVGTAGHVDHGKSTLVRALTGHEPDRWEEERRRGLTIDLGFAWTTLPGGVEAGFVDVPGHERFIKNMLAGVDAVDVALFVVAADEGWMPQSEEHLQVLDLLGVSGGVIALTRADLVEPDLLELAEIEVAERVEGTVLQDAPIIPTAAPSGIGVSRIADALAAALSRVRPPAGTRTRLWVDRVFTIGGAGTVVTGTLLDGPVATGDLLTLWPGDRRVRVRGLQRHEEPVERVAPGSRVALNLVGVDHGDVERGAMLARPGQWHPTGRFLADLRTVRSLDAPLQDRGAFHLHVGSGVWPARLRLLAAPGERGPIPALVRPSAPLPLKAGDKFVIREVGRRAVVAGGVVLDPHPPPRRARIEASLASLRAAATADRRADALLEVRGIERTDRLGADSGGGLPEEALSAGEVVVAPAEAERLVAAAAEALAGFHSENPLRPGMGKPELAVGLGIQRAVLEALVEHRPGILAADGATVRLAGFSPVLDEEAEAAWTGARRTLAAAGPAPPPRCDLGLDEEQVHALLRDGRIEAVGDFAYLPGTLDEIVALTLTLGDGFTVADFRTAAGVTRKHAVPLLEWLDREGVTRRVGDGRVIRR